MRQCCATGSLHTGIPTGREGKLHGLDCYIAEAPNGSAKGVVVIIPDAFGWTFPNNRILADCYAKEGGFTVYLPEFMDGQGLPEASLLSLTAFQRGGFWAFFPKIYHMLYIIYLFIPFLIYCRPAVARPRIESFLRGLKENEARELPVGTAGFCWGGKYVTELCWDAEMNRSRSGERLTDCGYTAHPSRLAYPGDIEKVRLPYSVAAAENDMMMSKEQAKQTEVILKEKSAKWKDDGIEHEFVMYEGATHGFAVRADEDQKHEAEQGKKAEKQAVDFFSRWFANPPM